MGLDQKGEVVFRVSHGENSQWDVYEKGFDKPLASFDSEREACSYANDLAKTREGSKVVVEGRKLVGRLSLPAHSRNTVKITIVAAAALLLAQGADVPADGDRETYNRRAAQADMSLFRELGGSNNGFLIREDTRGDLRLGPRFDDIDINRDGIVTQQEMRIYIEQTYGALPARAPEESR